jgi:SAM-dependent methyltransferase
MPKVSGDARVGHCPACGSTARDRGWATRGLGFHRCDACGLVYTDPQPRGRIREKYTREYDLAAHFGQHHARKQVLFQRRLDRLGAPSLDRRRLFDVGCGDGLFLELAARRGWQVYGVELNPPAIARARERGAQVFEGALEELLDLPWGTFDVVTSWDSIEHTPEPRPFAEALARLLAPAGRLMLTTMNRRSLAARVFRSRWSLLGEDHFTYWDRRSLVELFETVGLTVTDLRFFGLGRDFVLWMDRLAARRRPSFGGRDEGWDSSWESAALVTASERVLNRVLDATGLGVGIEIRAESNTKAA